MAAKRLLTEEVKEKILKAIGDGLPMYMAAALAGIHRHTIMDWKKKGQAEIDADIDGDFARFVFDYQRVEAELVNRLIERVERGMYGWQGAATILERRFHEFFGRRQPIDEDADKRPTKVVFNFGGETKDVKSDSLTSDGDAR